MPPDPALHGFTRIAMSVDLAIAQHEGTVSVAQSRPELQMSLPPRGAEVAAAAVPGRRSQLLRYIQAVHERHRRSKAFGPMARLRSAARRWLSR